VLLTEKRKLDIEIEYVDLKMKEVKSEMNLLDMKKNAILSSSYISL
jgi:hypothetical protein